MGPFAARAWRCGNDHSGFRGHAGGQSQPGQNNNVSAGSGVLIGASPVATGGSGTYTYSWSPSTGLSAVNVANPTATPTSTTPYTVTVTDSVGCTAISSVTVGVNVAPAISTQPANTTVCSGSTAT